MNDEARKQRDIVTVRFDEDIDVEALLENGPRSELHINMGISSILGTRKNQQDTVFGQVDHEKAIGIVCDGMGGMNGGEIASQTAARILAQDYFEKGSFDDMPAFFHKEAVKIAAAVSRLTNDKGEALGGGTTVVCVAIEKNKMFWLSVGDSKIYIIRNDEIIAVNREHNYRLKLDDKLKKGLITEEQYKAEEAQAEALISFIGVGNVSLMDINAVPFLLMENDIVLLCSDGLYKRLPDSEIMEIIKYEEPDMERAAKRLTDIVKKRTKKVQDNTSLVLMQYSRY